MQKFNLGFCFFPTPGSICPEDYGTCLTCPNFLPPCFALFPMFSKLGVYALITKLVLHFFLHAFCGGFFFFSVQIFMDLVFME